jgi:hypothetical protein
MLKRKYCLFIAAIILLTGVPAAADPTYIQVNVPSQICLPDKSKCVDVPEGRYLDEKNWQKLDAEKKAEQDLNTRLKAENDSFRKSANEIPWLPVAIGAALGIVLGAYVGYKI